MKLLHLSPTQVSLFLRCGQAYAFRYCEGLKIPPSGAMVLGRAVGTAVDHNYRHKMAVGVDAPEEEVLDVFSDSWEQERSNALLKPGEEPGHLKDDGLQMTLTYRRRVAPQRTPLDVQHEFKVDLELGEEGQILPLRAIADLLEVGRVWDLKTSRRAKSLKDLVNSIQMAIYAMAYQVEFDEDEPTIGYETLVRPSRSCKTVVNIVEAPAAKIDFGRVVKIVQRVVQAIEAEQFLPASPDAWWCSKSWCGYWDICKYGGKI